MKGQRAGGTDRLLFGCMGLGGAWSDAPYDAGDYVIAEAALRAAAQAGITMFDHANIYRNGKAEALFGEVVRAHPSIVEGATIQTKCGIRLATGDHGGSYDLSADAVRADVGASLDRLQLDAVDVLLLHRPDPLMDVKGLKQAIRSLVQEARIGALGVSNMSAAQIDYLQSELDVHIVVNQLEMSLHKRDWLESSVLVNHPDGAAVSFPHGTIEWCLSNGTRLQAWGALAQGLYSAPRAAHTPAEAETTDLVGRLAQERGCSPEAIVLGWLLKHPAQIEPVIGSTNPGRITACADAPEQAELMSTGEWYALWTAARGGPLP